MPWNVTLGAILGLGERPRDAKRATVPRAATARAMMLGKGAGLVMTWNIYFCSCEIDRSPTLTPRSLKRRTMEEWYFEAQRVHTKGSGPTRLLTLFWCRGAGHQDWRPPGHHCRFSPWQCQGSNRCW